MMKVRMMDGNLPGDKRGKEVMLYYMKSFVWTYVQLE